MEEPTRIVVLGKTGAGKSSLLNTIIGENVVETDNSANSGTKACKAETTSVNGRSIKWIDTPGFFDTEMSDEKMKDEIVKCITECASGPHAFLIVLKVEKFTEHEQAVITKICEYASEEALRYAIVVFTYGDQLEEGQTIEQWVDENANLRALVKKCGERCHVVDNRHWKHNQQDEYRNNKFQVAELLKTLDKMTKANNGRCYTNNLLQGLDLKNLSMIAAGVTAGGLLALFLGGQGKNLVVALAAAVARH